MQPPDIKGGEQSYTITYHLACQREGAYFSLTRGMNFVVLQSSFRIGCQMEKGMEEMDTRVITLLDVSHALRARKECLAGLDQRLFAVQDRIEALQSEQGQLQSDQLARDVAPQRATEIANRIEAIPVEIKAQETVILKLREHIELVRTELAELERYDHACRVIERGIQQKLLSAPPSIPPEPSLDDLPFAPAESSATASTIHAAAAEDVSQAPQAQRVKLTALATEHRIDPFLLLMVTLFDLVPGVSHRATSARVMHAGEKSGVFSTFGYDAKELILKGRSGWGGAKTPFLQLDSTRNRISVSPSYVRTEVALPWRDAHLLSSAQIRAFRRGLHGEN